MRITIGVKALSVLYGFVAFLCLGVFISIIVDLLLARRTSSYITTFSMLIIFGIGVAYLGRHSIGLWNMNKKSWMSIVKTHRLTAVGSIIIYWFNPNVNIGMQILSFIFSVVVLIYFNIPSVVNSFK